MRYEVGIWSPPGRRPAEATLSLAAAAGTAGGKASLEQWLRDRADASVAYAHGERHDLWWEFQLAASFKWQGHVSRLNPHFCRQRIARLARLFDLAPLLGRQVESLSPYERARANVAVALLSQPDLLVWEEAFRTIPGRDWMQLARTVRRLCRTDGLTVLLVAANKEDSTSEREDEGRAGHSGDRNHPWTAGQSAAAGGTAWA